MQLLLILYLRGHGPFEKLVGVSRMFRFGRDQVSKTFQLAEGVAGVRRDEAVTDLAGHFRHGGILQKRRLIAPQQTHEYVSLLQSSLGFIPAESQSVGRAGSNCPDVLLGRGYVLRRIDDDVAVFRSVLVIENVSTKRRNKVQPLVPERETLLALNLSAIELLAGAGEELC